MRLLSDAEEFKKESLTKLLQAFTKNHNLPFKNLMKEMRFILSGLKVTDHAVEILVIFIRRVGFVKSVTGL